MKIVTPCKVCGSDVSITFVPGHQEPPPIHSGCDTRPANDRNRPHPSEGVLAGLAFDATLALAEASATPTGSSAWKRFDHLSERIRQVQHANTYPPLRWAAEYYTKGLGWPIFPLQPGGKAPLTRHGFKDATTDPAKIQAWWKATPEANIGIPTGQFFDVIDVDTPIRQTHYYEIVERDGLEVFGMAGTSSGGYHLFVKPGELPAKNATNVLGPGIDYRTKGGYVVGSWSRLDNGAPWRWWSLPANAIRRTPSQT